MVNPFSRAKDYVRDHKTEIVVGIGVAVVSVIVVMKVKGSDPTSVTRLMLTPEQLQYLIDNTEGVASFEPSPRQFIWVLNSTTKEVFP